MQGGFQQGGYQQRVYQQGGYQQGGYPQQVGVQQPVSGNSVGLAAGAGNSAPTDALVKPNGVFSRKHKLEKAKSKESRKKPKLHHHRNDQE